MKKIKEKKIDVMKEKEIDYSWRERNINRMYVTQRKGQEKKKYVPWNLKWKKNERSCDWNHRQTENIELEGYVLRRMSSVAADHTMGE
jgi:hypothetical protein